MGQSYSKNIMIFFHMVDMDILAKISESQKKASFYFDKKGSINSKNNPPPPPILPPSPPSLYARNLKTRY